MPALSHSLTRSSAAVAISGSDTITQMEEAASLPRGMPCYPSGRASQVRGLKYLDIADNSLFGQFHDALENMSSLQELHLGDNNFTGALPTLIGSFTSLTLSGTVSTELGAFANLMLLDLSRNNFTGVITEEHFADEITNLWRLQYLDLSGNSLSGVIPRNLSNLTAMTLKGFRPLSGTATNLPDGDGDTIVDVNISGQFGEMISVITKGQQLKYSNGLAYFVSIDLSGNSLTGEIPLGITSLDALINLNLSSNCMQGNIPNTIGAMRSLESMDLSKNKFIGEIPSSLSNLTSLSYLNLSCNNLCGKIPSGRQLETLNADDPSLMYIGNSGLCGPPLRNTCSGNDNAIHGNQRNSRQILEWVPFYVGLVLGLVAGLWMVFCALLFKKTWRIAYFQFIDKLYDRIYVFVVVKWAPLTRKANAK
ncbi:hypothetical protein PR202_gb24062 [Eleusine coracana subsp. coracana]|uniref:Uncharacterized protein n=1 Tax=Eleusine coracana subsp. coracana TaxID=191504 RepID=A0AAV5FL42_ELECO|nr:hypothetical protein PR202_gb24062 [Eleusine coracana subsp. coracana]